MVAKINMKFLVISNQTITGVANDENSTNAAYPSNSVLLAWRRICAS